jgi:hypothetical protein
MRATGADMRILVVRNDKIGDFMLAWPSFAMLKQSCDCHITALVPSYTAPLAQLCSWIDEVIIDPGKNASKEQQTLLLTQIKGQFDAAITLFSTGRIGWLWRDYAVSIPYYVQIYGNRPDTLVEQLQSVLQVYFLRYFESVVVHCHHNCTNDNPRYKLSLSVHAVINGVTYDIGDSFGIEDSAINRTMSAFNGA